MLGVTPTNIYTTSRVIFIENIFSGMGTTAFISLLMTLYNHSLSATQFALLSMLASWQTRSLVSKYDWPTFYLISMVISLPSIFFIIDMQTTFILYPTNWPIYALNLF
ncbi:MAG: hypothetical protein ACL7BU_01245 [Candidatus Phlomobacter fragariae]